MMFKQLLEIALNAKKYSAEMQEMEYEHNLKF